MAKGQFIVMKTGTHPMISPLKLYFKWGIDFEEPYVLPDRGARTVSYMEREAMFRAVEIKYPQKREEPPDMDFPDFKEPTDPGKRFFVKTGG